MKLDHLYSLRRNFTVIGLTGRTGSGCTKIAESLCGNFDELSTAGLRLNDEFSDTVFSRKYLICRNFLNHPGNWNRFEMIRYVNVLVFFILNKYGGDAIKTKELLTKFYKESKDENNARPVANAMSEIIAIDTKYKELISQIKSIRSFKELRSEQDLLHLNNLFFGNDFNRLVEEMLGVLEKEGYFRTRLLLHWVSCNIRGTGDPLVEDAESVEHIYSIADLINRLIKARRTFNKRQNKPTRIVIDSLRNSLEIMFFKQRFSAFYMVATKDVLGNAADRINRRLKHKIPDEVERKKVVKSLLRLDEVEYKTKDFSKGKFSSPDVENCIQKSDFHILNLKRTEIGTFSPDNPNGFFSREEQLMKLVSLIQHPGLITPSSAERAMQIANTAKLNSGCISRRVGAVVTDSSYFIMSIGWNDVAKGHMPCNLRSVTDYFEGDINNSPHYSEFEKGNVSPITSFKYKGENPGNFKEAIVNYFGQAYTNRNSDLNGKNCSFCFKSVHNHYEGEANQVHTRSLHAEENAMLQITKLGGMGAEGGFLFTTASPCELCSKKAYQLGITKIFYIDPYPGIAVDQILKGGQKQPELIPFSGAIGNAYDWLYESFMSYKDELTMTLELRPKTNLKKEFSKLLEATENPQLLKYAKKDTLTEADIMELLISGLQAKNQSS